MNLFKKKNQLLSQLEKVDFRIHEVHYAKSSIERDVTAEFQAMLERLKQAESAKVAFLAHDSEEIQLDVSRIDDMLKDIEELTSVQMDPQEFYTRSRQLDQWADYTLAKPPKPVADVNPYDLPQELKIVREKLNQTAAYQEALNFKDRVIHDLIKKRGGSDEDEFNRKFQQELSSWSK